MTADGDLMALDGKINLDDNALYRHPDLVAMRDITQEDEREAEAASTSSTTLRWTATSVAWSTARVWPWPPWTWCKLHGGTPANFLDVGGGTTAKRVAEAFKLILSDERSRRFW